VSKLLGLRLRSSLILEPVRDSSQSEEDYVHVSSVKMTAEEEIHCGVYASTCANWEVKGNKRKNAYAARKSRTQLVKFQANNTV